MLASPLNTRGFAPSYQVTWPCVWMAGSSTSRLAAGAANCPAMSVSPYPTEVTSPVTTTSPATTRMSSGRPAALASTAGDSLTWPLSTLTCWPSA